MKKQTEGTKISDVKRAWHLIDVNDKILGRAASEIAQHIIGKSKPYFVRNLDCGDYVVVTNAKTVKVSGKKETKKIYYRYSGYPGGLTAESLDKMRIRKPEEIIRHAVKGMLPQNRLRDIMLARLFVFEGPEHTYGEKFKGQNSKLKTTDQK